MGSARIKKRLPRSIAALVATAPFAAHALAPSIAAAPDITELSLEQLTNVVVTSVSRREERLVDAPASIFVITAEDIRRSGATSIPEALRLAPNLQVARADNNQYAISARGYNNVLANKMLVLIDGRTVYTPLFSGVFWEAQDTLLADIERIEVISGPAATLWGANGVNGVINIRTYSAAKTQGAYASAVAGNRETGAEARYGGRFDDGSWRIYAKYFDRDHLNLTTGPAIRDESRRAATGFRTDWQRGIDTSTLQGDAYWGDIDQVPAARTISGGNLLGRWQHALSGGASVTLQAYYDRTNREHPLQFKEALDTLDLELQHEWRPLADHRLVWGGGYRVSRDRVDNSASQAFMPEDRTLRWGNVFAQDEIRLRDDLELTLGAKVETNIYTGSEWLPNVRLSWQPARDHLVWGALSRAVRAPSRIDRDLSIPGAPPFLLVANDTFASEIMRSAEIGYRAQVSSDLSFSLTAFRHEYPNLRSLDLSPSGVVFANTIEGTTNGVEGWGSLRLTPYWRVVGGFVWMKVRRNVIPGMRDLGGMTSLGDDPDNTAMLRSSWDIGAKGELDLTLRHSGTLPGAPVPAYTVLDGRFGWRFTPNFDASVVVQNAADHHYAEWGAPNNRAALDRNAYLRVTWKP